jgi:hypothetical protein
MLRNHGISPAVAMTLSTTGLIDPDDNSTSGASIRIIGFSTLADDISTVIVRTHQGTEYGVNGWPANAKDRHIYLHASTDHEERGNP